MKPCPNCNEENLDVAQFCGVCGTPLATGSPPQQATPPAPPDVTWQPQPNGQPEVTWQPPPATQPENAWQGAPAAMPPPPPGWGQDAAAYPAAYPAAYSAAYPPAPVQTRKKFPVWILIAGLAVVLAAAIFVMSVLGVFGGGGSNTLLYLKDREIFYTALNRPEPTALTERMAGEADIDNNSLYQFGVIDLFMQMSADGKQVLYPDRISQDGFSLYYKRLASGDAIKIDSDIQFDYQANKVFDCVFYIKQDTGTLYAHNFESREVVARDVIAFWLAGDSSDLVYTVRDDDDESVCTLYYKPFGKDAIKLDSYVNYVLAVDGDRSRVFYAKNESLYYSGLAENAGREKIASGVESSYYQALAEDGQFYFTKKEDTEMKLTDYVIIDDSWIDAEQSFPSTRHSLHVFDGQQVSKLCDDVSYTHINIQNGVVSYEKYPENPTKVKSSDLSGEFMSGDEAIREVRDGQRLLCVAVGGQEYELGDLEDVYTTAISSDASVLYALADFDSEKSVGSIYSVRIAENGPAAPELYDDDVTDLMLAKNDDILYAKNMRAVEREGSYSHTTVDFYRNGEELAVDVLQRSIRFSADGKTLYYLTDYSPKSQLATLWRHRGGTTEKVADDVYQFVVPDNASVAYLYDYDTNRFQGELYLAKTPGKGELIDTDVGLLLELRYNEEPYADYGYYY